jgi:hypothetical protein
VINGRAVVSSTQSAAGTVHSQAAYSCALLDLESEGRYDAMDASDGYADAVEYLVETKSSNSLFTSSSMSASFRQASVGMPGVCNQNSMISFWRRNCKTLRDGTTCDLREDFE